MRTWLLVLTMAAVSSPALSQQCHDAETAKLREIDKAWAEATRRGDRAQLQAPFADDFARRSLRGSTAFAVATLKANQSIGECSSPAPG
jgi:hypothetical protein